MAIYKIEIPDEVAAWLLKEKGVEPLTYIQNNLLDPVTKEYGKQIWVIEQAEAEKEAKRKEKEIKDNMKVVLEDKKEEDIKI